MAARIEDALRAAALRHEGVQEGIACKGTAIEAATFGIGKKVFLFLRPDHVRFKLSESLADARSWAERAPERCEVGGTGWVKVTFGTGAPPLARLRAWIDESRSLVAAAPKARAAKPAKRSAPVQRKRSR